jgi:hypothetical protein
MARTKKVRYRNTTDAYKYIAESVERVVGSMIQGHEVVIEVVERQRNAIRDLSGDRRPSAKQIEEGVKTFFFEGPRMIGVRTMWSSDGDLTLLHITVRVAYDL